LNIIPSTIPADYATFTARASLASTAIHLGKRVGDTIEVHWPVKPTSPAPNYDATLVHLKRRNALIPVTSESTPPEATDISAYGIELLSQQYKEQMVTGMEARMTDQPSPVYLDLFRGQIFSAPQELKIPICANIARSWEHSSPLLRLMWTHYQKVVKLYVAKHFSNWFPGGPAAQDAQYLSWLSTFKAHGTREECLAQILPPGVRVVDRTNGVAGPMIGGVLLRLRYTDINNVLTITDHMVYPPRGTEGGWSGEAVEIYGFYWFAPVQIIHFASSTGINLAYTVSHTSVLEYHDAESGYLHRTIWTKQTAVTTLITDLADNHRIPDFPTYATAYALDSFQANYALIRTQWLELLPYTDELAFKIERYLLRRAGITDRGVDHQGQYLVWLLEQMQYGSTSACTGIMKWEDDAVDPLSRVRHVDSFCIRIGFTSSIGQPGGAPLNIVDISQNGLIADRDGREIPVIFTSRDEFDGVSPDNPISSYSAMTGAEIKTVMTKYQQRPDFPAEITQTMIDELGTQGMGAVLIPVQTKANMSFENSALNGATFENTQLTGDTLYVSRDANGEPITFNEGLILLEENGFFDDTINQLVLIPYQMVAPAPIPVTVTIDTTLDPVWDVGIMTFDQLRVNLLAMPQLVIMNGTTGFIDEYAAITTPPLDYATTLENRLRVFLGLDVSTASKNFDNSVDLSPLNPTIYTVENPLRYADGSAEFLRYQIPLNGSYVDMAMIQKDIPKAGRYIYNAILMPLISKLDPL
jgi:hypothetical protein